MLNAPIRAPLVAGTLLALTGVVAVVSVNDASAQSIFNKAYDPRTRLSTRLLCRCSDTRGRRARSQNPPRRFISRHRALLSYLSQR